MEKLYKDYFNIKKDTILTAEVKNAVRIVQLVKLGKYKQAIVENYLYECYSSASCTKDK